MGTLLDDFRDPLAESWEEFCSLDMFSANWAIRWLLASVAVFAFLMIFAWKIMVPFTLLAIGVTLYLRHSRSKDAL